MMPYFYPRPPRGGRPAYPSRGGLRTLYFYPRPPRGGRPRREGHLLQHQRISIHALREEGDSMLSLLLPLLVLFLSTPSARRATRERGGGFAGDCISIHALREEGDFVFKDCWDEAAIFLSTPSARRATHARVVLRSLHFDFYPRPPRGGRPRQRHGNPGGISISIHALREEGDTFSVTLPATLILFLSTPSARRATENGGLST